MDDKQCEIYRDRVNERLQIQDKRLDNHSERLDAIEKRNSRMDERVDHLIEKIDELVESMKWLRRYVYGVMISAGATLIGYLIKLAIAR